MRKFVAVLLVVFMSLSLFACGGKDIDQPKSPETTEKEPVPTNPPAQGNEGPDDENSKDEPSDGPVETAVVEKPKDINPVANSKEEPAKIGDWIETKRYSAVDSAYHTVYYRVKNIIRYNDGVQAALDAWNDADHITVFDPLENDDLEYCMLEYEVYFPEDFPQKDWGITNVDIRFKVVSPTGGGIKKNNLAYIGLSSVYDISDKIDLNQFYSGQTFTDGRAVFVMVKDVAEYVIETSYRDDEELFYSYIEGK